MTLRVDLSLGLGYHKAIFDNLVQIVRCDAGLISIQPNLEVLEVRYNEKSPGGACSKRIVDLCDAQKNILIVGVDSSFVFPGTTVSIMSVTGGATERETLEKPIIIWLDVTDAGGQYYVVHDKNKQRIHSPAPVSLYHELSHAYHLVVGDYPGGEPGEVQAIADENVFRSQLGLPLRHPADHYGSVGTPDSGGVAFPSCEPEWAQNWGLGHCIVATAATGSEQAPSVLELRRARDEYRSLSEWASQIAEPAIDQYWRFAPGVVREMKADPALREAILIFAVQPVASLLAAVEAGLEGPEATGLLAASDAAIATYAAEASAAGCDAAALTAAAEGAAVAARRLGGEAEAGAGRRGTETDERHEPENLFGYLATEIAASGRDTSGFAWGCEGLSTFLHLAAAKLETGAELDAVAVLTIAEWLGRLPLPADGELDLADLPGELQILGQRLLAHPRSSEVFAARLSARLSNASTPALSSLLAQPGPEGDGTGAA